MDELNNLCEAIAFLVKAGKISQKEADKLVCLATKVSEEGRKYGWEAAQEMELGNER